MEKPVGNWIISTSKAHSEPRIEAIESHNGVEYQPHVLVGHKVEIGDAFHLGCVDYVRIEREVLIGSRVTVVDHDHCFEDPNLPIRGQGLTGKPVIIGAGSWIGNGAAILKGVKIGKHSVVGANSVVTKDVPAYSVVAGNPAKVLRTLPKPKQENLLSIIIPVRNGVRFTVSCIESIMAYAPLPYEVIVVDNGSTDSTLETLEGYSLADRVIHFDSNRGYAAACNAGARAASGDYLCFINNDTLATENTFEAMLDPLVSLPEVGMVGPMCNAISGWQKLEVGEKSAETVARELEPKFGQVLGVPRIAGVCFTIRRSLFEEIGGFDEGYGLGNFEDDDLCHRVLDAGHSIGIALGGYVFHYGSQTFIAEKIDYDASLARNRAFFEKKFGETHEQWIEREVARLNARAE